jgi:hypothetical protein
MESRAGPKCVMARMPRTNRSDRVAACGGFPELALQFSEMRDRRLPNPALIGLVACVGASCFSLPPGSDARPVDGMMVSPVSRSHRTFAGGRNTTVATYSDVLSTASCDAVFRR